MGYAEHNRIGRYLPPPSVLASDKYHIPGAQELTQRFASFPNQFYRRGTVDVPDAGFGRETKEITEFGKAKRPVGIFGVHEELFIEKSSFAHGAATNHHGAAGRLSNVELVVELAAIDLLPAAVLSAACPEIKSTARVPNHVGPRGEEDFGADDSDARVSLHRGDHLGDHVRVSKGVVIEEHSEIETTGESVAESEVVGAAEAVILV